MNSGVELDKALNALRLEVDGSIVDGLRLIITEHTKKAVIEAQNKLLKIGTGSAEGLASVNMGEVSDGYHTFDELYYFRMLYNAALFNEWARRGVFDVHKSYRHADGELCFGKENYFVVVAQLPGGQITNHYHGEHWVLFKIPERERAAEYDGHKPQDTKKRLRAVCLDLMEDENRLQQIDLDTVLTEILYRATKAKTGPDLIALVKEAKQAFSDAGNQSI